MTSAFNFTVAAIVAGILGVAVFDDALSAEADSHQDAVNHAAVLVQDHIPECDASSGESVEAWFWCIGDVYDFALYEAGITKTMAPALSDQLAKIGSLYDEQSVTFTETAERMQNAIATALASPR